MNKKFNKINLISIPLKFYFTHFFKQMELKNGLNNFH